MWMMIWVNNRKNNNNYIMNLLMKLMIKINKLKINKVKNRFFFKNKLKPQKNTPKRKNYQIISLIIKKVQPQKLSKYYRKPSSIGLLLKDIHIQIFIEIS